MQNITKLAERALPHRVEPTSRDIRHDEVAHQRARKTHEARDFVFAVYQSFFGREPDGDVHVDALASGERSYADFIRGLVEADEFKMKWSPRQIE
jgi:hypothetical protein